MAESDKELSDLSSQIGSISKQFVNMSTEFTKVADSLQDFSKNITSIVTARAQVAGAAIAKFGDVASLNASELAKVASMLGKTNLAAEISNLSSEWEETGITQQEYNAELDRYRDVIQKIKDDELTISTQLTSSQKKLQEEIEKRNVLQFNRLGRVTLQTQDTLKLFNSKIPGAKMVVIGELLMQLGDALSKFREAIYKTQEKLGTTFATATDKLVGSYAEAIKSYFTSGPKVSQDEIIDSIKAFQTEFGRTLTSAEARRFAQTAKGFGTDILVFQRAQRAFLGAGGLAGQAATQQTFITQFRAAGLTANQALKFAADNANLIAIAGTKYANELARAAANAARIGVGLDKTEQLADSLVGDFEGALERFSELRAMGVEVDFNRLAAVAGTGTPEEIVKELSSQFGGNKALLEEVQRNRFLKVAIERDLGLSISDVKRLAGVAGEPAVQTTQEKNEESLTTIGKWLPVIAKSLGVIISIAAGLSGAVAGGAVGGPLGAIIGGVLGFGGAFKALGMAQGGLITGPGTATSDNILTPTSPGEYVVNAKATQMYGTDMLNNINKGSYTPQQAQVNNVINVNMDRVESKLDKLASAFSGMKIEMDGNTVGRVSLNARSPLDRLSVVG